MAHKRHTSNLGIRLIKEHEGLELVAYQDPVGIWTIGWGHTTSVHPGMFINYETATQLLLADVQHAEKCINREVKVPITQSMFDALTSFVFNLGCGAFRTSTLLGLLNAGNYLAAADQFPRWVFAGGRQLRGLVRRRALEQGLFLSEMNLLHNYSVGEIHDEDSPASRYHHYALNPPYQRLQSDPVGHSYANPG